jgi:hypothetical protein
LLPGTACRFELLRTLVRLAEQVEIISSIIVLAAMQLAGDLQGFPDLDNSLGRLAVADWLLGAAWYALY